MTHPLDFVTERCALQIPTVWDVTSAAAAREAGAEAIFLSGSALAGTMGFPDVGLVSRDRIVDAAACIARSVDIPLLVDIDEGLGSPARLGALVEMLSQAGIAGVMIEDVAYPGAGRLCEPDEMLARMAIVRSASRGLMKVLGRTDILGPEWPFSETMRRLGIYKDGGADWVIAEGIRSNEELAEIAALAAPAAFASPEPYGIPSVSGIAAAGYCAAIVDAHAAQYRSLAALYAAILAGNIEPVSGATSPWRDRLRESGRFRSWLDIGRGKVQ